MDEAWIELVDTLAADVKKAASYAKEKSMSDGIINGLNTALQGMEELKPLIRKKVHFKRLRADLKDLVRELLESIEKGDENTTMGNMRTLRDRVNVLKALFSREA
ncbi:MAG: hypothetical protein JRJ20_09405 [Deltaproteobacteria bacterium]|nr:hypothetical protein [Deltaproteobacteria bacterium]MBW2143124.1 hypothetical protein [Deltaproteobacteria bacterium]